MKKLIKQIYGPNDQIETELKQLIKKYRNEAGQSRSITHRDVALITYGDQIQEEESAPLAVLHEWVKKKLGDSISIIHILPFYPYSSDDGFSVIDYEKVKPEWGTWDDVKNMSEDFNLMFDAVINHISAKSDWLQRYLAGDDAFADYFIEKTDEDWSNVVRPRTSPLFHAYPTAKGKVELWTTFSEDQVDLNYANPKVFLHVTKILLEYIKKGAGLIRLDAIGFMWKEPGTPCIHHEKTHAIIQLMREMINQVDPDVKLITETNVPHKENVSYFGNGSNEAHMVYNFTLPPLLAFTLLTGNADKFIQWMRSLSQPSKSAYFFNFLASHDGIGVRPVEGILDSNEVGILVNAVMANEGRVNYRSLPDGSQVPYELNCTYFSLLKGEGSETATGIKRMLLAHAVLLAMPGLPAIYFQSLVGSENDVEGMKKTGINRSINRKKFLKNELDVDLQHDHRNEIFNGLVQLIAMKHQVPDLAPASSFSIESIGQQSFLIRRGNHFFAYYNPSDQEDSIQLSDTMIDLSTNNKVSQLNLQPYGFSWLLEQ